MYRVFSLNRSTGKEDQMRYDFDRREWERAIESGVKTADKP